MSADASSSAGVHPTVPNASHFSSSSLTAVDEIKEGGGLLDLAPADLHHDVLDVRDGSISPWLSDHLDVVEEPSAEPSASSSSAAAAAKVVHVVDRRALAGSLYDDVLHVIFRFNLPRELVACSCTNRRWRDAASKCRGLSLKWNGWKLLPNQIFNEPMALRCCLTLSPLAGLMRFVLCDRHSSTWDILPQLSRAAPRLISMQLKLNLQRRDPPQNIEWRAPKNLVLFSVSIDVRSVKCVPETGDVWLWTELQSVMEGLRSAPALMTLQASLKLGDSVSLQSTPMMPASVWEPIRGFHRLKNFVWTWGERRTDLYWSQGHMDILRSLPKLQFLSICSNYESLYNVDVGEFSVDALRMLTADPAPPNLGRLVIGQTRLSIAVAHCLVKLPLIHLVSAGGPVLCRVGLLLDPLSRTLQKLRLYFLPATLAAPVVQGVAKCTKLESLWISHPNLTTVHLVTMLTPLTKLTELSLVDLPSNEFLSQLPSLCERITTLQLGHYFANTPATLPAMPRLKDLGFGRRRALPGREAMAAIDPRSPQCDRGRFPKLENLLEILSMPVAINPIVPQAVANIIPPVVAQQPQPPHPPAAAPQAAQQQHPPAQPPAHQPPQQQQRNGERCVLM